MQRNERESYLSFVERATVALTNGDIECKEWSEAVLGQVPYSAETIRRIGVFFELFLERLEQEEMECTDEDKAAELKQIRDEIKAERMKLQTVNAEYNGNIRADARSQLFEEKMLAAINRLEPIGTFAKHITVSPTVGASGLLCLSDFHAGSTYEIKGLYGEVVNAYSYDIMCDRLWRLIGQMEADDMVYDDLTVACLGDFFEGILRQSSLIKLREPVTDTVIRFSEFFANWLVQLHDRLEVPIKVVTVGGNHDINRLLGQKPDFEGEQLGKYVVEFLKLRLKDCSDIVVEDYTDVAIKNIHGTVCMFEHGHDRDLKTTIDYFNNLYNVDCDMIFAGHLHTQEVRSDGIADVGDKMLYRVGSIIGIDPYAKSIRKGSRPSCFFGVFTDEGLGWQKPYYLG